MPALTPRAMPVRENNSALLHVLEAYIETLKAENESLKRQLAARERCPWWCRRLRRLNWPSIPSRSAIGSSRT